MDNNFGVYTDFQYVSRKSKGKRKRRSRPNIKLNTDENSDNSDAVETTENDLDESSSNQTNEFGQNSTDDNTEEDYCKLNDRISIDAQLKAKPQILEPEIYENLKPLDDQILTLQMGYTNLEPIDEVKETFNVRALPKHAETYELEKFEKNVLIIFNQVKVDGYIPRYGTDKDVAALKSTFERFGFEVNEHKDLTKKDIFDTLETCE